MSSMINFLKSTQCILEEMFLILPIYPTAECFILQTQFITVQHQQTPNPQPPPPSCIGDWILNAKKFSILFLVKMEEGIYFNELD